MKHFDPEEDDEILDERPTWLEDDEIERIETESESDYVCPLTGADFKYVPGDPFW